MIKTGIIIASDKAFNGTRKDLSEEIMKEILGKNGFFVEITSILPDEEALLSKEMINMADNHHLDLILSTGGTGFSERDVTPEATEKILTRKANGIAQAILFYSLNITPRAMLSRGVSGVRNKTLIVNLPGSPKALREILEYIMDNLKHGIDILKGDSTECANDRKDDKNG